MDEWAGTVVAAEAVGLVKVYGVGDAAVRALDRVDLQVRAREFTAVMGPSGSGKSTLMHCLAGLETPTEGEVAVEGVALASLSDKRLTALRRDRIGFVFQSFNLIPTLTARENVLLPLALAGRRPDDAWVDLVVRTLGLDTRLGHRPSQLSGGQQQRVACARALVAKPAIVFADEPTGNLDSRAGADILAFLRRSVDDFGQTVVMVTHDAVAASFCDRIVFLADGRVVSELGRTTRAEILAHLGTLAPETSAVGS